MAYRAKKTASKRRLRIFVPLVLGVLLVGGAGAFVWHKHQNSQNVTAAQADNTATAIRRQNTVDYSAGNSTDNDPTEDRKNSSAETPTLNSPSTTANGNSSINVTIVNASVRDDNGSKVVHVGNTVSSTTAGTCTLTATQTGQSNVTQQATVTADNNTYSCGVFNVPTSRFPHNGIWKITLSVANGDAQGSATGQVTL